MRVAIVLIASVLASSEAYAQCARPAACFCTLPRRYGIVTTESVDGARAVLRVERAGIGLTDGQRLELPRTWIEAPGKRWLLLDASRKPIDEAGHATCSYPLPGSGVVSAEVVMDALAQPVRCEEVLESAGLVLKGCSDVRGCGTSVAFVLPFPLLLGFGLRRRSARSTSSASEKLTPRKG